MFVQRACLTTVALALGFAWGGGHARGETPNKSPPALQPAPSSLPPMVIIPSGTFQPLPPMVSIPGGTFQMGSNPGLNDMKPVHSVTVAAFSMDRNEVTVGAYRACTSCSAPDSSNVSCNWGKGGREGHPINCVDWHQATSFCAAVGKRLPTEEEWEYAARGTDDRKYPWGNTEPSTQLCWDRLGGGKPNSTCSVGAYPAGRSPFGLNDMAGNVWEWTSSPYCSYTNQACSNSARVFRGGGWSVGNPAYVRGAIRGFYGPGYRNNGVGFRCAR